ncbi:MAG TPA: hypothetical protein VMH39_04430 [Gemmatimonadaceae bacterium]|nr:hypothetical protein [Gemmatimonadaceae bacterium]
MARTSPRVHSFIPTRRACAALILAVALGHGAVASAQGRDDDRDHDRDKDRDDRHGFLVGDLVVSRSVYRPNPAFAAYPYVWNQDLVDASFGITSAIFLDEITPFGELVHTVEVPNSAQKGISVSKDQMVTSFSSKSELALNLSTDGRYLTFMGYLAPVDAVDVSNSNTPMDIDPTNPVTGVAFRVVARVDAEGTFDFTTTNAYSGNNGRAAILSNLGSADAYFTAGNAGNGSNPQPNGIILGAGAQIITPQTKSEVAQHPGDPTPVASFSVTQLGGKADKVGKDDNFRGLTIFNNVLYFTKGSGSNGVNTVYFVDTHGGSCPNGVGLPHPGAALPTTPLAYTLATLQASGLPNNMCILSGFPAIRNSSLTKTTEAYPFGLWFANATTLYVADEGDGDIDDAGLTPAGLQKWVFDANSASWVHVYTLQTDLGLGSTYRFPGIRQYPTGINAATGLPWAPITDGLRNITGRVNRNGTVTIWGVTSTASGNGDPGADPNKLVAVTDILDNVNPMIAEFEPFVTVRAARFGEVLRGVAFAPGSDRDIR